MPTNVIPSGFLEEMKKISEDAELLKEVFKKWANEMAKVPASIKTLAENGWFFPYGVDTNLINSSVELIKKGEKKIAEKNIIKFYDKELKNIQEDICSRFPHRKKAISAAIRAHERKEYYLSIPVFLAQSEGICTEITGFRYFKMKKSIPATKKWAANFTPNSVFDVFLEPLKKENPLTKKQEKVQSGINRHDILHGDSVDYGEDIANSYKAFSLLCYLSDVVYDAKDILFLKNSKK